MKVVLADDHPVVREGLRALFEHKSNLEVAGEAANIRQLITVCSSVQPDLIILDINLEGQNSLEKMNEIRHRCPKAKVVIFSSYDSPGILDMALATGVNGYILKDTSQSEWLDALDSLEIDKLYLSPRLRNHVRIQSVNGSLQDNFQSKLILSEQEKRVVKEIVKGLNESEIADVLGIKKHTVHSHKKNLMRKLGLHSNAEVVRFAYDNQLV